MVRALLMILALAFAAPAQANSLPPEQWTLRAIPDAHPGPLYAREMLTLTLRGDYGDYIALENLTLPPIKGLGWLQLGHDQWREEMVEGLPRRIFERRIAVWPEEAGPVTIPILRHKLTLAPRGSVRRPFTVLSAPLTLDVAPPPIGEGEWFLPARGLVVEEEWSGGDAEALRPGQPLTRVVRLTVWGLTPDRIGPQPSLKSETVFAFSEPEERSVEITPDGPIARVVWRWSVLPDTPRPTVIPPLTIRWFDTGARAMRTVELPAKRIAVAGDVFGVRDGGGWLRAAAPALPAAALLTGAVLGLWLALRDLQPLPALRRLALPVLRLRDRWRLRRAARRGDAFAARRLARALAAADAAPFDRLAYGPDGSDPAALSAAAAALLRREPSK